MTKPTDNQQADPAAEKTEPDWADERAAELPECKCSALMQTSHNHNRRCNRTFAIAAALREVSEQAEQRGIEAALDACRKVLDQHGEDAPLGPAYIRIVDELGALTTKEPHEQE